MLGRQPGACGLTAGKGMNIYMRVGMGYDVHRLVEGRDLIMGGVKIPYEKGLDGHSDADVLCMRSWMRFSGQQRWGTSESIFRIRIRHMRELPA